METKHTREYAEKLAIESLRGQWGHLFINGRFPKLKELPLHPLALVINKVDGYMMAVEQTAAPELLEALVGLINGINPQDACRGKYKDFYPENPEIAKEAYVGAKSMPADEQILKALEAIEKATK